MVLFSAAEADRLREKCRKKPAVLNELREACGRVQAVGLQIPQTGIATWGHYFACPEDAARLDYDYANKSDFRCPRCGKIYRGEPYLGAWWRITNSVNCSAAFQAALLWLLEGEASHLDLSRRILCAYANNYPHYEEHGDIPYNKPGRMNSQIICEADCLETLAKAYDVIKAGLSPAERSHIERDLLIPGAELLIKNRTEQLHNHEVVVNAALGIIGLALERRDYTDFALNSPYGLIYQLEHGVLSDGMWFESTFGYHYFALIAFMNYEKMACGTPFSLLNRPEYRRMYRMPLRLLQPDYSLPRLGDGGSENMFRQLAGHYEFMYRVYGEGAFAGMLNKVYARFPRAGLEAFLYGSDDIEDADVPLKDYHDDEGSGLTVLRGSDRRQYLLFRHGHYGGEHDHYDKLSLHYACASGEVMPDLGTVAYGAPPHYDYFKNTFTHNTVCIDGQNQPPCNGHVSRFFRSEGVTVVECRADWRDPGPLPDSFILRQWDEEAYRGTVMDRTILFTDDYFLDAFRVRGAAGRRVDWIIHPKGKCAEAEKEKTPARLPDCKPAGYLKNARGFLSGECEKSIWQSRAGRLSVLSLCSIPAKVIYAEGPDNPMNGELTYFIRSAENAPDDLVFATIFRHDEGKGDIENEFIEIDGGCIRMRFCLNGVQHEHSFTVGEGHL